MAAPTIENKAPATDALRQPSTTAVAFSVRDDVGVDQSSIQIYVNGVLVWRLSVGFAADWITGSTVTANAFNGWDFSLSHSTRFAVGSVVQVQVLAADFGPVLTDETWSFSVNNFPQIVPVSPVAGEEVLKDWSGLFGVIDSQVAGTSSPQWGATQWGAQQWGRPGLPQWGQAQWGFQQWGNPTSSVPAIPEGIVTVEITVDGVLIYDTGSGFIAGWINSIVEPNLQNGFDYLLRHIAQSDSGDHQITVTATNQAGDTKTLSWSFDVARLFPFSTYRMMLRSIRSSDEESNGRA